MEQLGLPELRNGENAVEELRERDRLNHVNFLLQHGLYRDRDVIHADLGVVSDDFSILEESLAGDLRDEQSTRFLVKLAVVQEYFPQIGLGLVHIGLLSAA